MVVRRKVRHFAARHHVAFPDVFYGLSMRPVLNLERKGSV